MTESYVDPQTGEIHVPDGNPAEPGTDLVPAPPSGVATDEGAAPAALVALLGQMKDAQELDPEEISKQIIGRILNAATVDEVLSTGDARHARELLGQPILIHSVKLNESDFTDSAGVYMVAECSDPDFGESFAVTFGSPHCMAQAYKLHELGALPAKVKFTQSSKPTRRGFFPMRLEPA